MKSVASWEGLGSNLVNPGPIRSAAFGRDGRTLVTGGPGGARVWDVLTGRQTGRMLTHLDDATPVEVIDVDPDVRFVLARVGDRTVLWEAATGKPIGPSRADRPVGFAPNGSGVTFRQGSGLVVQPMPAPVGGSLERVAAWASVITGLELDADGLVHHLFLDMNHDEALRPWRDRYEQSQKLGGPPPGEEFREPVSLDGVLSAGPR